jgi:hypothetical protein
MGLTASNQRIAHMTLTPITGWQWLARLELGAPIRRRARVRNRTTVTPDPPFSPTPCETAWDSFDDRETLVDSEEWGNTSVSSIPWVLENINNGGGLTFSKAWVSGGIAYLRNDFTDSNGLACAYVESGPAIGEGDWEVLFRFRVPTAPEDGVLQIALMIQPAPTTAFYQFAVVQPVGDFGSDADDIAPNIWYLCRFERESAGSTYRYKVWPDGTIEPSTWEVIDPAGPVNTAFGFVINANGDGEPGFAELHFDWIDFGEGCEAAEASSGQDVAQAYSTSDGTTTDYRTRDPYMAGSLAVYADDIREWHITETDPDTGDWEFDDAPFSGETVRVEYRAA